MSESATSCARAEEANLYRNKPKSTSSQTTESDSVQLIKKTDMNKMDTEIRFVLVNLLTITILFVPATVIVVISAVICLLKKSFTALRKIYVLLKLELEFVEEVYGDNEEAVWDKHGLFIAFIKGEELQTFSRQKKKKFKHKKAGKRPITVQEVCSSNFPTERPSINSSSLNFANQCTVSSQIGAHRACALSEERCHDKGKKIIHVRKEHKLGSQARAAVAVTAPINLNLVESLLTFRLPTLPQSHRSRKARLLQWDKWLPVLNRGEMKRYNVSSLTCPFKGEADKDEKLQVKDRSLSSSVESDKQKRQSSIKDHSDQDHDEVNVKEILEEVDRLGVDDTKISELPYETYDLWVGVDKKLKDQQHCAVNQGKKRSNPVSSDNYSSRLTTKKRRKERLAAIQREQMKRRNPANDSSSSSSENTTGAAAKKTRRERVTVQQRNQRNATLGQMIHAPHSKSRRQKFKEQAEVINVTANLNEQLETREQEQVLVDNAPGELANAKRPLPVTPLATQPSSANGNDTSEDTVSLSPPSITQLISLFESLHVQESIDLSVCVALDDNTVTGSDGKFDDDSDAEYDVFPDMRNFPNEVIKIIESLV